MDFDEMFEAVLLEKYMAMKEQLARIDKPVTLNIKALRYNANLDCRQAAELLGISTVTLTQWENYPEKIKPKHYKHIANAYGVPMENIRWTK